MTAWRVAAQQCNPAYIVAPRSKRDDILMLVVLGAVTLCPLYLPLRSMSLLRQTISKYFERCNLGAVWSVLQPLSFLKAVCAINIWHKQQKRACMRSSTTTALLAKAQEQSTTARAQEHTPRHQSIAARLLPEPSCTAAWLCSAVHSTPSRH